MDMEIQATCIPAMDKSLPPCLKARPATPSAA